MQRSSNLYIIIFTAGMTLLFGGLLSATSVFLKPLQTEQVELDTKKKILAAVMDMSNISDKKTFTSLYSKHFESQVITADGKEKTTDENGNPLIAERINIQKNHKIDQTKRYFPVFLFRENKQSPAPDAYIFPMFGTGLWDWISGYVALDKDLNTIRGIVFDHKTETPGLGARITEAQVQARYKGKKIFDDTGLLLSVSMIKGEKGDPLDAHHVDGMSGATMTARGVNTMLKDYLSYYSAYIEKQKELQGQKDSL